MNFAMKSMPVGMDLIMLSMVEAIQGAMSVIFAFTPDWWVVNHYDNRIVPQLCKWISLVNDAMKKLCHLLTKTYNFSLSCHGGTCKRTGRGMNHCVRGFEETYYRRRTPIQILSPWFSMWPCRHLDKCTFYTTTVLTILATLSIPALKSLAELSITMTI